ncbi:LacI family DNA-binding transcriptional regulator [Paenibacillus apiarius]|uniref:LacI family DNA-binding transcriptional regulator n=1 Tax=Paenibacillus apiarius TaxID=46240 RepID=UPI0019823B47|nr:LacI family DNA-binding transcriptional regulator [Paenibacillus apiarius]MBN3524617.1 LacI family DNA-binding transcriptional regulator [Paenibacillus apiarius]
MAQSKITQQHIADALSLSRNTVSKALNNDPGMPEDTKRRVIQKALELGYTKFQQDLPPAESALAKNRLVSLLTHSDYMGNHYWSTFLRGLNGTLKEAGYTLAMTIVDMEEERELRLPALFLQQKPAGVIMIGPFLREYYEVIEAAGIPSIFIDTHAEFNLGLLRSDIMLVDNAHSVYTLTRALIAQGHRQIGFVGDIGSCLSYRERWTGFQQALREADLRVNEACCIINTMKRHYYNEDELQEAFTAMKHKASAFVCVNDAIALEMMQVIRNAGLRIPDDIVLTGFDNITEAMLVQPSLTTVHVPKEELGMRAGEQIVWRMGNISRPKELVRLAVDIIWRDSFQQPV